MGKAVRPGAKVKQGAAGIQHCLCSDTAAAMPKSAAMPKADDGTTLNTKEL